MAITRKLKIKHSVSSRHKHTLKLYYINSRKTFWGIQMVRHCILNREYSSCPGSTTVVCGPACFSREVEQKCEPSRGLLFGSELGRLTRDLVLFGRLFCPGFMMQCNATKRRGTTARVGKLFQVLRGWKAQSQHRGYDDTALIMLKQYPRYQQSWQSISATHTHTPTYQAGLTHKHARMQ